MSTTLPRFGRINSKKRELKKKRRKEEKICWIIFFFWVILLFGLSLSGTASLQAFILCNTWGYFCPRTYSCWTEDGCVSHHASVTLSLLKSSSHLIDLFNLQTWSAESWRYRFHFVKTNFLILLVKSWTFQAELQETEATFPSWAWKERKSDWNFTCFRKWAVLMLKAVTIARGNFDHFLHGGFFQLWFTVWPTKCSLAWERMART